MKKKDQNCHLMQRLEPVDAEPHSAVDTAAVCAVMTDGLENWMTRRDRLAAFRSNAVATVLSLAGCLLVVHSVSGVLPMISSGNVSQAVVVSQINHLLSC